MDESLVDHSFIEYVFTPSRYLQSTRETALMLARAHAGQPMVVEERDMGSVYGIVGFLVRWPTREIADATLEALLERIALELMQDGT